MRPIRRLIAALVLVGAANGAYAQTLHVISIADSNNFRIGIGAAANSKGIENYATLVSDATNLQLDFAEVSGSKFNCDAITKAVENLNVQPHDVVIFYYSGHGLSPKTASTDTSQSAFPSFFCSGDFINPPDVSSLPNLEALAQKIRDKGGRLTLAIADTCNVIIPVPEVRVATVTRGPSVKDTIRDMFLRFSGLIVISSSRTGEFSWYRQEGGLFSSRFLQILNDPSAPEPKQLWNSVITAAARDITLSSDGVPIVQHPQSLVDGLKYHQ